METEEQLNEQIYMEINEQIFRDVAFSLNFDDDVYQQVLKDFGIKRLRYKMGGDQGIHLGFLKQDPPIQVDPNL
jgi:hypothetical protein